MTPGPAESLSPLIAATVFCGGIGARSACAVFRDVRREKTAARGISFHREADPLAFWSLIFMAAILAVGGLLVAGGAAFVRASAFVDQGTWPVVQPRRKPVP